MQTGVGRRTETALKKLSLKDLAKITANSTEPNMTEAKNPGSLIPKRSAICNRLDPITRYLNDLSFDLNFLISEFIQILSAF